ncbi:type IV secretory system conjugative DNA transfer family protein [Halorhabdus rudnickae]|uniref:type IV secretory system conjugative DNA transfer family protein n=1 Tax=Halorhabdus rudnickae TaxID=1775544 RepID=UPI001FCEDE52|nr:TraM recognition domain-containing protein [Halorhabdus rudnickae]
MTGYGKSTLFTNNIKQLIEAGQGVCFIDPKGDDSRRIAEIVPEDRKDDIIWIEPGSSSGTVSGFNFINVGLPPDHPQIETAVSALVDDLKKMLGAGKYWGPRMDRIAGNIIRAMNTYNRKFPDRPDLNLADLYYVLMDPRSRHEFAAMVKAAGIDFIEDYTEEIAEMEDDKLEPILGRMQPWIESPAARRMICFRKGEVNIPQAVEEGKIIIVRMGGQPDDLKKMLGMAVVRRIWATIRSRAEMAEHERSPFYLFVDEAHHVAMADETFPKMLAAARSLRLSINLATQYLSQLPEGVVKGIRVNCDTFMSFNAGSEEEAKKIAPQLDLNSQSLLNESRFHIWLRLTNPDTGELTAPFKVYIHPPFPPLRTTEEADQVIENSLEEYGREKMTPSERKRRLQFHKGRGNAELGVGEEILLAKQDSEIPPAEVEARKAMAVDRHKQVLEGDTSVDEARGQAPSPSTPQDGDEDDEMALREQEEQRLLECTYAARVKAGLDTGEPVETKKVKAEIEERRLDFGHEERLADLAEGLSEFIELDQKSNEPTFALTGKGRSRVFGSTGADITGGDVGHRRLLRESFKLFTRLGYQASLPTQEGIELPDGLAETPFDPTNIDTKGKKPSQIQEALEERMETLKEDYPHIAKISEGKDVSIEAESSTLFKPAQCLTNFRKAIDKGHFAAYVTKDAYHDDDSKGTHEDPTVEWAAFIDRVLHDTTYNAQERKHETLYGNENLILAKSADEDGHRTFYNQKSQYRLDEEHTAVREATEGRSDTTWEETDDGIVAKTGGEVFAKFDSVEDVIEGDTTAVPAYYHYDQSEDRYIVEKGGETLEYATSDELEEDWETFKAPFLPQEEFPEKPTEDDYIIIVIPDADNPKHDQPLIYDQGDVIPIYDAFGIDVPEHGLIKEEEIAPEEVEQVDAIPDIDQGVLENHLSIAETQGNTLAHRVNTVVEEEEYIEEFDIEPDDEESDTGGAEYLFPEVETLDELPDVCPECGSTHLEISDLPFAGPAGGLENFPSVAAALAEKGVLKTSTSPPIVTDLVDASIVECQDCAVAATIYPVEGEKEDTTEASESSDSEEDGTDEAEEETTDEEKTDSGGDVFPATSSPTNEDDFFER